MTTDHTIKRLLATAPAVRGAARLALATEPCTCGPNCSCADCACGCGG